MNPSNLEPLKRMRPVCANRELELEQHFVGGRTVAVIRASILRAHLAELARPVRDHDGSSCIEDIGVVGAFGSIEAHAGEPAPRELIVARDESTDSVLTSAWLLTAAPYPLAASDE